MADGELGCEGSERAGGGSAFAATVVNLTAADEERKESLDAATEVVAPCRSATRRARGGRGTGGTPARTGILSAMHGRWIAGLLAAALTGCAGAPRPLPAPEPVLAGTSAGSTASPVLDPVTAAAAVSVRDGIAAVLEAVEGEATYYADRFHGRRTASGVVFDNGAPYAAHRTWPFGTLVRVTNLANDRSVVLRVVDRGPFGERALARGTIIDVSRSAAEELDFVRAGRTPVLVEVLEWGTGPGG